MTQYLSLYVRENGAHGGLIPELNVTVTGKDREQVRQRLQQGAALALIEYDRNEQPRPEGQYRHVDDLPADIRADLPDAEPELIEPAPLNRWSLEIEQAVQASGLSDSEIARRMETSPAAVGRLQDPFYWGHSLASVRKLYDVLDQELLGERKSALVDELGRLARAVVPAEDRKRAGPLEQWGRTPVQFSAVAHDGRAVHFRNRLYDVTYRDLLSPIVQVTGVDDEGRPASLSGHLDTIQWRATYLGFQPAEPRRPEYVLPV
ncbi:hypothetical protein [Deinococcus soli (ex Cha et al. 2016)]|uniref:Uncharacterized protein n=1 Tax=Deinococcus soli (ex Cha et al. 2016) TaxID=1309411 RepID=A0ACC6KPN5_9DEIO|nr:hypothetical protein [Deinococcus soli (ex Cha et al. 2016)]MDR6330598.1 hypothetical protein [Deinococcus soli (ex Cha et al. 2016)]MDR6754375.1 hypothetical protein [Deinococcus soli (ex Cha et al. 2016)]